MGKNKNPLRKGLIVSINVGEGPNVHFTIGNLSTKIRLFKPWIGYTEWSGVHLW